ncbi:MAG: iron-sulfur cluster assembly accessory protein [Cycloclasticus sp.]|jgi:iron-sulfur cluster assembly protein|nr:iron-sulfur cluster assembly accessory protein [Cycloclasticus sp.]MDF1689612.1 iron-sulfur cluster assembly accessory protein [Cycloclasticus sp.]MEE4292095.1 iron-sulfur cluster assembly accessory protein [Cycloclasticus sp.]
MSVKLTESAAIQVQDQLNKRGKGLGLRLGVRESGCSGYSYVIDFADKVEPADTVFEEHGVKVIINQESLSFLDGLELDFAREGINSAFKFNNPNVTDACGCGESFTVDT